MTNKPYQTIDSGGEQAYDTVQTVTDRRTYGSHPSVDFSTWMADGKNTGVTQNPGPIGSVSELWTFSENNNGTDFEARFYSPTIVDDGNQVLAIVHMEAGSTVYALNLYDGTKVWEASPSNIAKLGGAHTLVKDGVLCTGQNGGVTKLNLSDGSEAWTQNVFSNDILTTAKYDSSNDYIYVGTEDGVKALAESDGTEQWFNSHNPQTYTQWKTTGCAFDDTYVYYNYEDTLRRVDKSNGNVDWSNTLNTNGGGINFPPSVGNKYVFADRDNDVAMLDKTDGSLFSSPGGTGDMAGTVAVRDEDPVDHIVFGNFDDTMTRYETEYQGVNQVIWGENLGNYDHGSPIISSSVDRVYSHSFNMIAQKYSDGNQDWSQNTTYMATTPAVYDEILVTSKDDDTVVAYA